jgi:ABC-type multidrug transport system fused ATPase/permease subunit
MQKIFILYSLISWVYALIVVVICFLALPKVIKESNNINESDGILKKFYIFERIFYQVNEYLCSNQCLCPDNQKMSFQKCPKELISNVFEESLSSVGNKNIIKNIDNNKFMSYWSKIEKKFDCVGLGNNSDFSNENNFTSINKYLFSNNQKEVKKFGCLYSLSNWLNKMILSFSILLLINIILLVICLYIAFAILYDKVYEGSNLPEKQIKNISEKENRKSLDIKINNNDIETN